MDRGLLITALAAFSVTAASLLAIIPALRRLKMGQRILEIGPAWHSKKQGTPTMGGVSFIIAVIIAALTYSFLSDGVGAHVTAALVYVILNGAVGMLDDLVKLKRKQNEGLSAFTKFLLQLVLATAFTVYCSINGFIDTFVYIPFWGSEIELGKAYYPIVLLFLTGFGNAVNLSDGLDGLCSSVSAVTLTFLALITLSADSDLAMLSVAGVGICLGFLIYNRHPARVFMGDTGSLFLGALISSVALLSQKGALLFIAGGIYVTEAASVILQVLYYKLTKKRLFLIAPYHHHLERKGMGEVSITRLFVLVSALLSVIAYFLG